MKKKSKKLYGKKGALRGKGREYKKKRMSAVSGYGEGGETKRRRAAESGIKLRGRFFAVSSGGIFFETSSLGELSEEKYYVDPDETLGAMNGDTVTVCTVGHRRDVAVTKIEERAVRTVIGTVYTELNTEERYLAPDDSKIKYDFKICGAECTENARDGDKAEIRITGYPDDAEDDGEGVLTAVFGDSCTREANYSAILRVSEIVTEFGKIAESEAASHEHDVLNADGREDLRSLNIFTVDGAGAKDLDDAISVKRNGDGYILGVHIADVSNYVKEDTELDREARARGTSVYFADKVVPMLPVTLSNGICSLNAGVDRYALSVFVTLDAFGEIKGAELKKSIINSKVRGVYSEINDLIDGRADASLKEKYACILDGTLDTVLELYGKLKKKSEKRGALELETSESEIILGEDGEPTDIIRRERGTGECIIEQFMLCANEAVALWLTERHLPCVYRVHEKPDDTKVSELILFAHDLGIKTEPIPKSGITAEYLGELLKRAEKKDGALLLPLSYVILRTVKKAFYSDINGGHFGLSSRCYCHFTSPIRRYPDLAVHRIISAALSNGEAYARKRYASFAEKAALSSSEAEVRALTAEREISALYKALYMSKHIGEEFVGTVSSVTVFGAFCMLDNTCEGLVLLDTMKNKYTYDHGNMSLTFGGKRVYGIGDRVRVRVKSVLVSRRQVDFELLDEPTLSVERPVHYKTGKRRGRLR